MPNNLTDREKDFLRIAAHYEGAMMALAEAVKESNKDTDEGLLAASLLVIRAGMLRNEAECILKRYPEATDKPEATDATAN